MNVLLETHKAAVAFEYILMIAIMSAALFAGFSNLVYEYQIKAEYLGEFVNKNGQQELGPVPF